MPTGSDGQGDRATADGFGQSPADGDRFGAFRSSDGATGSDNRRARYADGDRRQAQPWRQSAATVPTGATVRRVPRPVSRFHRSDGHGFAVAIFRQSPPTVTPTGAPVRRPDLPPTGSDGDGFGNRADGDRRTRSPSRSADGHADGFAVAIFRQGNGQQAATAPRPICRERFGTVTGSDGNGQRFATMPPTVTGSGGQPWRQSRRRGDGFGR